MALQVAKEIKNFHCTQNHEENSMQNHQVLSIECFPERTHQLAKVS